MKALIAINKTPKPSPLETALVAMTVAAAQQRGERDPMKFSTDKQVQAIISKANAAPGSTGTSGFGAEISPDLVGDYLQTLAPLSAAAQIIGMGLQVNMGAAASMTLPAREGAPSTTVSWVGELNPVAVRQYELNADCQLVPKKFGLIITVTRELAKRNETVVRQLLREDASASLDAAYFSTDAADTETHPGLLDGLTPLSGYAGADRTAMETDLAALADVVSPAGSGQLTFVVSPKRLARLKIKAPDIARELTFLPSLAVADTTVIALDPASLVHGFGSDVDIEASRTAALHMSDTPLEIVSDTGPTTADPVREVFQTDAIAFRLLVDIAFNSRRPNSVAYLTGATW